MSRQLHTRKWLHVLKSCSEKYVDARLAKDHSTLKIIQIIV